MSFTELIWSLCPSQETRFGREQRDIGEGESFRKPTLLSLEEGVGGTWAFMFLAHVCLVWSENF